MPTGIFGEAVDDDLGAVLERFLPQRPEEGVVDRDRRFFLAIPPDRVAAGAHRLDIDERVGGVGGAFEIDQRDPARIRSEEHTSELQSLMRISYAVFCLEKKKTLK